MYDKMLFAQNSEISEAIKEYVDQKCADLIPKTGYRNRLAGYQLANYVQPPNITISYSSVDVQHCNCMNATSLTINFSGDNLNVTQTSYVAFKYLFVFNARLLESIQFNTINGITQLDHFSGHMPSVSGKDVYFFEFFFHDITVSINHYTVG